MKDLLFVCDTSTGLDDLHLTQQRDRVIVLRHLHKAGRFSAFEATANPTIAKTMQALLDGGFITVDNSPGFPWSNVALTANGFIVAGIPPQGGSDGGKAPTGSQGKNRRKANRPAGKNRRGGDVRPGPEGDGEGDCLGGDGEGGGLGWDHDP